jgi:hypothetical protein
MVATRVSMNEVRVHEWIYTFTSSDIADQFQTCLVSDDLGECEAKHPPLDKRRIRQDPDDYGPGA